MEIDAAFVQTFISVLSFVGLIFFGFFNLRLKNEQVRGRMEQEQLKSVVLEKIEQVRREVGGQFVPVTLDSIQRETLQQRLESAEREIVRNRDSIHLMNNRFTELILGRLDAMKNQMDDQSRITTDIRDRFGAVDGMLHDFARRIEHLERRRAD